MNVEACAGGTAPYGPDAATLSEIARRLAPIFAAVAAGDRAALYVVSSNAGAGPAVEFWSEARRVGVAVASPELFPWTLANASCGWLARTFRITGPTFTHIGNVDALIAAMAHADEQLDAGEFDRAWVVAIDFARHPARRTSFAALRLSPRPEAAKLELDADAARPGPPLPASDALLRACAALRRAGVTTFQPCEEVE
jgi:3-oxoacyl-(acyl-carrier-protein) synthase